MYHWDELTTIYLALGKLKGIAKVWYDGLKTAQYSWVQWEHLLKTTFPGKLNFGQSFHEAASYKACPGQDLHTYCFIKLTKLNKLRLNPTDKQIIDVIIDGIQESQIGGKLNVIIVMKLDINSLFVHKREMLQLNVLFAIGTVM
uniref:Retrotransposon gag domain-containing protein n=1 Tax=Anoplophora glabripennis TaxID=217634 RepID=V5GIL0_ANOGL